MNKDKMYICVLDTVPDYIVPTLVAHATLRHHLFEVAGVYPSLCQLHDKEVLADTGVIMVHKVTTILL